MIISVDALAVVVTFALTVTAAAPVLLLVLLLRDWRRGRLW